MKKSLLATEHWGTEPQGGQSGFTASLVTYFKMAVYDHFWVDSLYAVNPIQYIEFCFAISGYADIISSHWICLILVAPFTNMV